MRLSQIVKTKFVRLRPQLRHEPPAPGNSEPHCHAQSHSDTQSQRHHVAHSIIGSCRLDLRLFRFTPPSLLPVTVLPLLPTPALPLSALTPLHTACVGCSVGRHACATVDRSSLPVDRSSLPVGLDVELRVQLLPQPVPLVRRVPPPNELLKRHLKASQRAVRATLSGQAR